MHLDIPFTLDDCQIAIFPAWQDGIPKRGPAPSRHAVEPLCQCVASISWKQSFTRRAPGYGATREGGKVVAGTYDLSISFPEGVVYDGVGRSMRSTTGGPYVVVALFHDSVTGEWQRYQFFHVMMADDSRDVPWTDAMMRSIALTAGYAEEDFGRDAQCPALVPKVYGYVVWHNGGMVIPCLRYDLDENTWEALGTSDTGQNNQPYALWDAPDISESALDRYTFSLFQPRAESSGRYAGELDVVWQQRLFFSMENIPADGVGDPVQVVGLVSTVYNGSYTLVPAGDYAGFASWSLDGTQNSAGNLVLRRSSGRWALTGSNSTGGDNVLWRTPANVLPGQENNPRGQTLGYIEGAGSGSVQVIDPAHGYRTLLLHAGITVECNGSAEPIQSFIQNPLLEESYCLFRVLDRVYMTVGHDRIAVPRISSAAPPSSTSFRFLIGDTILDDKGWWMVQSGVPYVISPYGWGQPIFSL